jgi:hypothetical protein
MHNRIFFQHPDLMRMLCVHENVMTIMMNTLMSNKPTVGTEETETTEQSSGSPTVVKVCTCC